MSTTINPTLSVPIFDGEVTVHGFGAEHGCNFSFRGIDDSSDAIESHRSVFEALASIPTRCDYFAPSPMRMNAEIVSPVGMKTPISRTSRVWNYQRNTPPSTEFKLYRGAHADGLTDISEQNGFVMSSADCALVVVKCGNKIIAAHAGRNSLIDMNHMAHGGERRRYESVVDAIYWELPGCKKENILVWVGFSISPGPHFAHEKSSTIHPYNHTLITYIRNKFGKECFADDGENGEHGWLDLKELIRKQCMWWGIPEKNIMLDDVCTCTDMKEGDYVWYSNVLDKTNRNLIAVVKNP